MSQSDSKPIALHGLHFDVAGFSEQGPRSENQDAFSVDTFARTGVIAVADGMGGERSGRLAADTALQAVLEATPIRSLDDARRAVRTADASVARTAGDNPDAHGGMGCALGFIALTGRGGDGVGWVGAHVGDVRILSRSPDGTIRLETRDHTPAFAKWEAGEITLDEIPDTAGANRLQRAVGRGGEADAAWLPARPGWSWLLISDGIYKALRLDELARHMEAPTAAAAVEAIRRKVEERGPDDNFTAVLVRALGDPASPRAAAPVLPERTLAMDHPTPPPARRTARSGSSTAATLLALVALIAAAVALWMAWQTRTLGAPRAEVEQIRVELDSLGGVVRQINDPFGPTAAPTAAPARDTLTTSPNSRPVLP